MHSEHHGDGGYQADDTRNDLLNTYWVQVQTRGNQLFNLRPVPAAKTTDPSKKEESANPTQRAFPFHGIYGSAQLPLAPGEKAQGEAPQAATSKNPWYESQNADLLREAETAIKTGTITDLEFACGPTYVNTDDNGTDLLRYSRDSKFDHATWIKYRCQAIVINLIETRLRTFIEEKEQKRRVVGKDPELWLTTMGVDEFNDFLKQLNKYVKQEADMAAHFNPATLGLEFKQMPKKTESEQPKSDDVISSEETVAERIFDEYATVQFNAILQAQIAELKKAGEPRVSSKLFDLNDLRSGFMKLKTHREALEHLCQELETQQNTLNQTFNKLINVDQIWSNWRNRMKAHLSSHPSADSLIATREQRLKILANAPIHKALINGETLMDCLIRGYGEINQNDRDAKLEYLGRRGAMYSVNKGAHQETSWKEAISKHQWKLLSDVLVYLPTITRDEEAVRQAALYQVDKMTRIFASQFNIFYLLLRDARIRDLRVDGLARAVDIYNDTSNKTAALDQIDELEELGEPQVFLEFLSFDSTTKKAVLEAAAEFGKTPTPKEKPVARPWTDSWSGKTSSGRAHEPKKSSQSSSSHTWWQQASSTATSEEDESQASSSGISTVLRNLAIPVPRPTNTGYHSIN